MRRSQSAALQLCRSAAAVCDVANLPRTQNTFANQLATAEGRTFGVLAWFDVSDPLRFTAINPLRVRQLCLASAWISTTAWLGLGACSNTEKTSRQGGGAPSIGNRLQCFEGRTLPTPGIELHDNHPPIQRDFTMAGNHQGCCPASSFAASAATSEIGANRYDVDLAISTADGRGRE